MIKMLIVDDDEDLREFLIGYINEYHDEIEVTEASNGIEAASLLESKKFDVLIADIFMRPLDGFELLKKYNNELDVFIISGTAQMKQDCIDQGAKCFICKPFTPKDFMKKFYKAANTNFLAP